MGYAANTSTSLPFFHLKKNKGPRREEVHRLYSLIPDVLAEDGDAGGFFRRALLGPLALSRGPVITGAQEGSERDFAWQKHGLSGRVSS